MNQIARIGLDIAKRWFQIHAVDESGREVLNRRLPRDEILGFLAALPACDVALEACSSSHYWGREIGRLGHRVSLISPNYVKPYLKRGKSDAHGRCTMAPVPSEEEEDLREAGRRRETLVHTRLKVENQIASLLIRHGIEGFKPRLKNAETKLCELRTFDGRSLPTNTMNSLRLLLAQHRLLSAQLKEIEEARQRVVNVAKPDRLQRMIQALARVVGVGVETATVLVHEVFSRSFKDRRALGALVGLTGTPYNSGGSKTEQGISKNGNARVRRMLSQLAWRWLGHQPESALAQWLTRAWAGPKGA